MARTRSPMVENIFLNAKIIAARKGIKTGELESRCGVSAGYFSRMAKNGSEPRIDTIYRLAHALDTTIDILINCPPEYNQENVVPIHDFAAKLIRRTIEGKIEWESKGMAYIGTIQELKSIRPVIEQYFTTDGKGGYRLSVRVADHSETLCDTQECPVDFMVRTMEDLYGTAGSYPTIPQEVRDIIDTFMGGVTA